MILLDVILASLAVTMLIAIARVIFSPTNADRVLVVDFGFAVFMAGIAVLAVRLDAPALTDLVLAATLLGFIATVVFSHLVEGRSRP